MTSPYDDDPMRVATSGSELERLLVRSATLDRVSRGAHERTRRAALAALAEGRSPRRHRAVRWGSLGFAGALAVAAAVVLLVREAPPPATELLAEPSAGVVGDRAGPSSDTAPRLQSTAASEVRPPCPKLVVARGGHPLIDDMEDGNARLSIGDGRSGSWLARGEPSTRQVPAAGQPAFPELIRGGRGASRRALHMYGDRLAAPTSVSAELSERSCYDASVYAGIKFWARGTGRIHVRLTTVDVMAAQYGGLCVEDCYDAHMAPIDLEANWKEHEVRWEMLEQSGWGTPEAFDPKRILMLDFFVLQQDSPFDFWVDDIAFITR